MAISMFTPSVELRGEDLKHWSEYITPWHNSLDECKSDNDVWQPAMECVENAVLCFLELSKEENSQELRKLLTRLIKNALKDSNFWANIAKHLGIEAPKVKRSKICDDILYPYWLPSLCTILSKCFKDSLEVVSNETAELLYEIIDSLLLEATTRFYDSSDSDSDDDFVMFESKLERKKYLCKPILWLQNIISHIRKNPSEYLNDLKPFIEGIEIRGKDLSEEKLNEIKDDKELISLHLLDCSDPSKLKSVLKQVIEEKPDFVALSVCNQKNTPLKIDTELMGLFVKLLKKPNFKYFTLSGCEIDESAQNTLVEAIGSSHIEYLDVTNCDIDLNQLPQLPVYLKILSLGNIISKNVLNRWMETAPNLEKLNLSTMPKDKQSLFIKDLEEVISSQYEKGKNILIIGLTELTPCYNKRENCLIQSPNSENFMSFLVLALAVADPTLGTKMIKPETIEEIKANQGTINVECIQKLLPKLKYVTLPENLSDVDFNGLKILAEKYISCFKSSSAPKSKHEWLSLVEQLKGSKISLTPALWKCCTDIFSENECDASLFFIAIQNFDVFYNCTSEADLRIYLNKRPPYPYTSILKFYTYLITKWIWDNKDSAYPIKTTQQPTLMDSDVLAWKDFGYKTYNPQQHLGSGGRGSVYGSTEGNYAIKTSPDATEAEISFSCIKTLMKNFEVLDPLFYDYIDKLIIKYYGSCYTDSTYPCCVMEKIVGKTLKEDAISPTIIPEHFLHLAQAATAIYMVHEAGCVIFDIKPENMMISDGLLKLIDLDSLYILINPQVKENIICTPMFTSPEKLNSSTKTFSPASDVYSLGLTFLSTIIHFKVPTSKPNASSKFKKLVTEILNGLALEYIQATNNTEFEKISVDYPEEVAKFPIREKISSYIADIFKDANPFEAFMDPKLAQEVADIIVLILQDCLALNPEDRLTAAQVCEIWVVLSSYVEALEKGLALEPLDYQTVKENAVKNHPKGIPTFLRRKLFDPQNSEQRKQICNAIINLAEADPSYKNTPHYGVALLWNNSQEDFLSWAKDNSKILDLLKKRTYILGSEHRPEQDMPVSEDIYNKIQEIEVEEESTDLPQNM